MCKFYLFCKMKAARRRMCDERRERDKRAFEVTFRSKLTCSICSLIFKDPIILPCGHTVCKEHLSDEIISCFPCTKKFYINTFVQIPNLAITGIINDEHFLSESERSMKIEIVNSLEIYSSLNQEFQELKMSYSDFEIECHNHFHEIRCQIDIHRENDNFNESRSQVDALALELIDKTKSLEIAFYSFQKDSLKHEFKEIDKEFVLWDILRGIDKLTNISLQKELDELLTSVSEIKALNEKIISSRNNLKLHRFFPTGSDKNQLFGYLKDF